MSQDIYKNLITEFSRLVGLADQFESIHNSGNLLFKDVAVTILFNEEENASVNVYVDFGSTPEHRALDICRRLLEINLLVSSIGSPRLGLDPQTSRVIFSYAHPLQGYTAEKLLGGIDAAVAQAQVWRTTFYLDDAPALGAGLRDALQV